MLAKTLREVCGAGAEVRVSGIAGDSRRVAPGDLFLAVSGAVSDGHDHVAEAVRRGAVAVCSERPLDCAVPNVVLPDLRRRQGQLAARFFDDPSADLTCIGVTGTNGKTSITHFCTALLPNAACIGTVGWGTPPRLKPSELTTASAVMLQKRLRCLLSRGHRHVALEASSHALDQGRVADVHIDIGVFSNLSRDHLDYHGDMARYGAAKRKLFEMPTLKAAAINVDDDWGRRLADGLHIDTLRYGTVPDADLSWSEIAYQPHGITGRWHSPWGDAALELPLHGAFSIANAAAAAAAACLAGEPFAAVAERLTSLTAPSGRMERIAAPEGAGPTAIIDYAHTPAALAAALAATRRHFAGHIVCVFGCGGERDRGKRPLMAAAAEQGADRVIVTSDNPRGEPPDAILADIGQGFERPSDVIFEPDRATAIALAIGTAGEGDVVLVAGKGHERHQEVAGTRLPYSDHAAIEVAFAGQR